jgi:hypothetical protein
MIIIASVLEFITFFQHNILEFLVDVVSESVVLPLFQFLVLPRCIVVKWDDPQIPET